jgi:transposase-like protein
MLAAKGMRFPIDVILVCIRWYAAYPLSYRHLRKPVTDLNNIKPVVRLTLSYSDIP